MLICERLEHLKNSWFFDANYLSDSLAIPKKKCAYAQSFFELPIPIPIPIPIPSKFSEKRMIHSPIPIPSELRGMTTAGPDIGESMQSCAGTLPYQGTIQKGTLRYKVP